MTSSPSPILVTCDLCLKLHKARDPLLLNSVCAGCTKPKNPPRQPTEAEVDRVDSKAGEPTQTPARQGRRLRAWPPQISS